VFGRVAIAWVATMPGAAVTAASVYWASTLPPEPLNIILMAIVLVALVTARTVVIRRAPKAADIDAGAAQEHEIPMRAGTGSLIHTGRVPASSEVRNAEARAAGRTENSDADQPL
jgi:hypothetical protein